MSEIVNLKDYINGNKEKANTPSSYCVLLEDILFRIKDAKKNHRDYRNTEMIADNLFGVEYRIAERQCSKLPISKGFKYFLDRYQDSDMCMEYITNKYFNQLLFYEVEDDLEDKMHSDFDTYSDFESSNPNKYIIDLLSKEDLDFAKYISRDIDKINLLSSEFDRIHTNWNSYYEINESKVYKNMIRKLHAYFRNNLLNTSLYETETIIYLGIKNNIIDKLNEYYELDGEKVIDLVDENEVSKKINKRIVPIEEAPTIEDNIHVINDMDEIMKHELSKLGKTKRL